MDIHNSAMLSWKHMDKPTTDEINRLEVNGAVIEVYIDHEFGWREIPSGGLERSEMAYRVRPSE